MHPNPAFRGAPRDRNLAFARTRGFGTLAVVAEGAPLMSHIPFLLSEDGTTAEFHLARSNPIARACKGPLAARLAVTGPHGYISPDWYGLDDQVPTWNYVAVHLVGQIEPRPVEDLPDHLSALSTHFETAQAPKPVWLMDKLTDDMQGRFMRMILPFRMQVAEIDGTWKLGQNKPDAARLAAAAGLASSPHGEGLDDLARLMTDLPDT
ncbi:FMN-binding negative transcriptional regulator [Mesobacterium pallidum]|uniref:FMN-binding negative transcriptional regulator n=1 Tax=Mesobacterium pallidum TaxID=2872037 RepID=UPI001EE2AD01|nr:FMN-binding negative transcriptional regulator [Mesobacterium pallidum]